MLVKTNSPVRDVLGCARREERPKRSKTLRNEKVPLPVEAWKRDSGSDGRRSRDLSIFSRTLYQLSYRALS